MDFSLFIGLELLLIGVTHEVGAGNFEGASFNLIIIGCLYHLQGTGLRFVEEAYASFGFDADNRFIFGDGEGVGAILKKWTAKYERGIIIKKERITWKTPSIQRNSSKA